MSHWPRGGGQQTFRPRNEQERQHFLLCRDLGIPYPPDPLQTYHMILQLKQSAEIALKKNDLKGAEWMYSMALMGLDVFPGMPHMVEERHKLLCNRSLVFLKMRLYKEAENDALAAIQQCPSFIKGYWRASQAVKGGYKGIERAMPHLIEGLRRAMIGEGEEHDVVDFLAEICILVPKAPISDSLERLLNTRLMIPDGVQSDGVWTRVVHKLVTQNQWQSVALLLTGYNEGVSSELECVETATWMVDDLNIAAMLKALKDNEIKSWGEDLAVSLIERGASVEEIGRYFGTPTLHFVVGLSLRLGLQEMLKCVLEKYKNSAEKKNEQDDKGSTVLHVLVQSPQVHTQHATLILEKLLAANCEAKIMDKNDKKPVDYVKEGDKVYQLLLSATKSVDELRKDLEELKSQGNAALKVGNHTEALKFYQEALKISQRSKLLYKEAAIVYSNQANVFFTLTNYTEALTNALAAISCDSAYHKGHWWNAKVLLTMGSNHDAFRAYMDGYVKSEVSSDVKLNFLIEAVGLLKHIPSEHFHDCYNQLRFIDSVVWPQVLVRLSRNVEWKGIAYLILGPNLEKKRFGNKIIFDTFEEFCTGVAGKAYTGEIQINTIFKYLDTCDPKKEGPWLDAVLFTICYHGGPQIYQFMAVDQDDCPLHATVRFALRTGRTSFIESIPKVNIISSDNTSVNGKGDSVFHCITKLRPPPEADVLCKVTEIIMEKGLSVMARDASGKLPVEYLDKKYPGYVYDIFFKETGSDTEDEIIRLKEEGNVMFKKGQIPEAIELYGKAIDIFNRRQTLMVRSKLTNHDIAVLYGNRAEGFLKLNIYQQAFHDAMKSVSFDGHWYKAHIRVGKALRGIGEMDKAMKAYVNAYNGIDSHTEDKVKIEILTELATVCAQIPKSLLDVKKRIQEIPAEQGHIWARACYELIGKGDWSNAAVAYYQYTVGRPRKPHLTSTLKPFCDLAKLKKYTWGIEMIQYFLECGCDRKTITLETGDTYLHAVVKMTLVVAKNMSLLKYLVEKYCRRTDVDQRKLDSRGNTVLHTATMEHNVDRNRRHDVIMLLLKCEVDPNHRNKTNHFAIDYLPVSETQSREVLRMAMYNKENVSKPPATQQKSREFSQSKKQPLNETNQFKKAGAQSHPRRTCDHCDDLFSQGMTNFTEGFVRDGYEKMTMLLNLHTHTGGKHEEVMKKAVSEIVKRLGKTFNPEIPDCLTYIRREMYLMIVDGLANGNKWKQLDMVVRKYRQKHGSDQIKGFASDLTVVPVVREETLKAAEELKLQIVTNLLNSGASLGTDNGQMAVKCAVSEEHFKVLTELVKRGADTTNLSMYDGDTPIHAALTIVLEKEKSPVLLEILLDQFEESPEAYPHLDPEQLDKNGDCLFHLIAKAKFSSYVLKLTETLCKRNLSGNYYNKEGKLPIDYVTKKNDRRIQYLRLARAVKPCREQIYGPKGGKRDTTPTQVLSEDELHQLPRPADREVNMQPVTEVVKTVPEKEKRKRRTEELIRLLPDSKHSIFKVENSHSDRTVMDMEDDASEAMDVGSVSIGVGARKGMEKEIEKDDSSHLQIQRGRKKLEKDVGISKVEVHTYQEPNFGENANVTTVKDVTKTLENGASTVERKTLEDVASGLKVKAKTDLEDDLNTVPEKTEDQNERSVNLWTESDSGPPSLEKEIDTQNLNSSYSTVGESIDEFVDALESFSETDVEKESSSSETFEKKVNSETVNDQEFEADIEGKAIDAQKSSNETAEKDFKKEMEVRTVGDKAFETLYERVPDMQSNTIPDVQREDKSIEAEETEYQVGSEENVMNEKELQEPGSQKEENFDTVSDNIEKEVFHERLGEETDEVVEQTNDEDDEPVEVEESDEEEELDEEEDFEIDVQVFDNLEWEVECTAEVWKTLRDKHVLPELKRRIVRKIQLLASGDWQPHLCKKLKNVPPSLNLFEAKFSKGRRIIWELAIAFSPRCSETAERRLQITSGEITQPVRGGRIYSEIIRVWEIVLDHDKIYRCVQRIKKSHQRGETCIIQKKLRGMKGDLQQVPLGVGKRYPMLYAEEEITDEELEMHHQEMQRFFPPASSNDTEYHILKFYTFSSVLVSHVLQNIETKVDFPFRVTDLEHAIINLPSKAPILLLGRSGTGKTTCCLYRLWSQFHSYWYKAKEADAPLLPRCVEFNYKEEDETESDDEQDVTEDEQVDDTTEGAAGTSSMAAACGSGSDQEPAEESMGGVQYDHIHQLFITKNAVLSNEVQKNFRELSHADDLLREHVAHEEEVLPSRLEDVQDYAFPLFLTSRQVLLMLDASIGPPYFFERKEDGALKVDIAGWTDLDGPLSFLPLLDEDSDAEEEMEQNVEDEEEAAEGDREGPNSSDKKLKLDPRREITYAVFVEEVWPRIKKGKTSYHPSLIWMEIMSFIKGSYEALSKSCGYLTIDEYKKLGRKRAPNFSEERDTIYLLFKRYEHFKKQNSLFDETDLVHDTYRRLKQLESRPWVIHQIFVDETQDFTQAELCLLIRLCQNPNDMFLTGDTAQSIMRGISFRFSDLRSLFYHAKKSMQAMGKTSAIEVPRQVYQLTHNYRSHAGILSLASCVLELMVEFFPESFDRLNPDQGLFNGPQPILLESCSFGDLAVLLRGNRRKTSHIEFGAHQAILVVNDAARESIPEELRLGLVLTIYEAKGLEFDDVLLYNFFKDSQALKEWRVVTEYLEKLAAQQKEKVEKQHDNLVEIDHSILGATGRPRPLNFDPNLHKVLNSELKHLYTALTRARVNVWIFDEDINKRAPMFEYFKVRKLVKCMNVEEINETSLSETVFAEKSSPADWIQRGEDFMRHSLYGVAAKCFGMGGDHDREKVALAHGQALKASRLKENPRQMREEFLYAAELYLECNRPTKAAICLQNAKERELAAGLFEKLGQYERAAEIYRKLKRPMSSSRCYEQLGNFNKAVEVLYYSENYDMAIDTLRRYHMLIKELKQKGNPVPAQLIVNKPEASYTEEKLSHRAANLFHKYKNVEKMLDAVDRFQNIDDKVEFLKSRNYIPQAAKILEEDGQLEKAANLLLMHGWFDEANTVARKTLKEEVIAHCLLVSCRANLSKKGKINLPMEFLKENLMEASLMFQSCKDSDQYGQVMLLEAEMSGNAESIKFGWRAFLASKPFPNDAGLVECTDWLIRRGDLHNWQVLQSAVRGIDHLFHVCQTLLNPNTQTNRVRVQKYDQFYGLGTLSQDKVVIHTKEKPLCMGMIQGIFSSKTEMKRKALEVPKKEVYEAIVTYLLNRSIAWLKPISDALSRMRDTVRVCDYFQAGVECPFFGDVDKPCRNLHSEQSRESFGDLLNLSLLMIEYEENIHDGAVNLKRMCPPSIKTALASYLLAEDLHPDSKYQFCIQLLNDLLPAAGHLLLVGNESKPLLEYIRRSDKVANQFKRYLQEKWKLFTSGDRKLKSDAARQTDVYLLFEFGYHLLGFHSGRRKLENSPKDEMYKLERILEREVASKPNIVRREKFYTLMMSKEVHVNVTCVAHRFTDAYALISSSSGDPLEALMKFSKFQIQLSMRKTTDFNFYPDLKTYLMWLEFYTCLAIFLISKLKTENFPDFVFVLPNHYFALIEFIQSTFPSGYTVLDSVGWWMPPYKKRMSTENHIYERLKGFAFVVSGHAQGIRILDKILESCTENPSNYALLERLLILNMSLVCNVGKSVVIETERSLISSLTHIPVLKIPAERIQKTLNAVKNSTGIADIANVLSNLLSDRGRGEKLLVCKWKMGKKQTIERKELQNFGLFEASFLNEKTFQEMHSSKTYSEQVSVEEEPTEADLDPEEIEQGRLEKEAQIMKEKMNKAVLYMQKMFRAKKELRRLRKEHSFRRSNSENDSLFEDIKVDDKMCGICGVFFDSKLEEKLELEKSTYIGGQSVLNENPGLWGTQSNMPETQIGKQSAWESSHEAQVDRPELRKLQLIDIREKHIRDTSHIEKEDELNTFKKKYQKYIAPRLKKVNGFLSNSAYRLMDPDFVAKHYFKEQMVIDRMKTTSTQIDKEIQDLLKTRNWSTKAGSIEQKVKELESDFNSVQEYVEDAYNKLKQQEDENLAKQAMASSSAVSQMGEDWDDELDDIEKVVDEPVLIKTLEFRNKKKGRRPRKKANH